ncbi:hypothetical protein CI102_12961 [Trichoderma harzianum]|nr:hypothetical protein CI102_12961 [Trichoderma harzianum]
MLSLECPCTVDTSITCFYPLPRFKTLKSPFFRAITILVMGILVLLAKIPPKSRLHGFRGLGLPQRINRHEILSTAATACVRKLFNVISTSYALSCVSSC